MVADRKGPADHIVGATDLVELIQVVFYATTQVQCDADAFRQQHKQNCE